MISVIVIMIIVACQSVIVVSGYSHRSSIATISWLTNYIVFRLRANKIGYG